MNGGLKLTEDEDLAVLSKGFDWLDARTGHRQLLAPIRRRVLPDGPRWGYTLANCLLWMLLVQVITGFLLMGSYSPSTTSAWASVHFIEQAPWGGFIRGLHYWVSQALIILFVLHVIRVLLVGTFRAPRELIWFSGLLLIPLLLGLAITGNPLCASQKCFDQIEIEGEIIGSTPLVGPIVRRMLIGGDDVGHLTLTHLYFLHVTLLPVLVGLLLAFHISQIYRHGVTQQSSTANSNSPRPYWPYQTVRNMMVLAGVMAAVSVLAWRFGAPLHAPADPAADPQLGQVPRPEWYLLSLFELRRYFSGDWEFVATIVIPAAVLLLLLAMPLIDRACSPRTGAVLRCLIVVTGLGALAGLTAASVVRDQNQEFIAARHRSEMFAHRARVLADRNQIPPIGAVSLLRDDAKTQGPILFVRHCAACHSHLNEAGQGIAAEKPSAANLYGFALRGWATGLFDAEKINGPEYFGQTEHADGEMADFVASEFVDLDADDARKIILAISAEAQLPAQHQLDEHDAEAIEEGRELITSKCTECHHFHDEGELGDYPDLTGWGSREWLIGIISDPTHERFYKNTNDRMPAFADHARQPEKNLMTRRQIELLVDWLRGEWYEPSHP